MIIPRVVAQHAEEGASLWLLRTRALEAPHFSLSMLDHLDRRVDAHLDGLRIAGDEGWTVVAEELKWEEAGEFFVAAEVAFETGDRARIDAVLAALARAPQGAAGVASALGWIPIERARPLIAALLAAKDPVHRLAGIAASAICRVPPAGPVLAQAGSGPDLRLRARALRAAGELGRMELLPTLRTNLASQDLPCRFWAAWSLVLLSGDANAVGVLRAIAEATPPSPFAERAAAMFARRSDPAVVRDWYRRRAAAKLPQARVAIAAAGALGDPEAVPLLLELMKQKPFARGAGEAFTFITGADLAKLSLDAKPPADSGAGPTEDAADENVAMDPDEGLPWPDPDRVAVWWRSNASSFAPGTRHLLGRPIAPETLREALRTGRQRQRAAAAVELAIRLPGVPLFETRAPGFQQLAALESR